MKKILTKYWPVIITQILVLAAAWPMFVPGYFSHHDDLQVMRVFEMRKCIEDLQIPCRWVPDMGYGNGYPLFNYYAVFPYFLGALASYLFGFVLATKLLFIIPILFGGFSVFLLANELYGKVPAMLSSILYTFTPFKALDIYVRGDVTESFAMAIVPLTVYFALKMIRKKSIKYMLGLSISLAVFLTSHNIMTVLFAPVIFLMVIYFLLQERWKNRFSLLISTLVGIGLSAFFILPAFFEKNLVQIENLIRLDLDFRAHFVTVSQLFLDRSWGYGASSPGTNDTISFQIGWPHWWIVLAAFMVFLFILIFKRKINYFFLLLLIIFSFSIFMTHIKSAFVWEQIEILKFTQFPWRFLSVAIFSTSLIGAYFVQNFKQSHQKYIVAILITLIIFLNFNFFKPKQFYPDVNDQVKLSGKLWEDQQKAAILDYLPQTAVQPREPAPPQPIVVSGKATAWNFDKKSNSWKFQAKVEDRASIEVPIFDFPKWEVRVNDLLVEYSNKNYLGRITVNFNRGGDYLVSGKFTDTPIRLISNIVSLLSLIILIGIIYGTNKKNFR